MPEMHCSTAGSSIAGRTMRASSRISTLAPGTPTVTTRIPPGSRTVMGSCRSARPVSTAATAAALREMGVKIGLVTSGLHEKAYPEIVAAFRAMGVDIDRRGEGEVIVHGVGLHGLQAPEQAVDLGIGRFDEKAVRRGHDRSTEAPGGLPQVQGGPVGSLRGGSGNRDPGRMPERQQFGVACQHHQSLGKIGHSRREIEGRLFREPAAGDQAAQVAVAGRIFHQAHRSAIGVRIGQFRSDDGRDALLPAGT